MSDNRPPVTEEMLRIGRQLRCPEGDHGQEVARKMADSNLSMIENSFAALRLNGAAHLVELGHGNGAHLSAWLAAQPDLHVLGLEISPSMRAEAERLNAEWVAQGRARFVVYDGQALPEVAPFVPPSVDALLTVNTVYFWADPVAVLRQLHAVMRQGGVLALGFAHASFMAKLPFTREGFTFYSPEAVQLMAEQAGWTQCELHHFEERIAGKPGEPDAYQVRPYSVLRAVAG